MSYISNGLTMKNQRLTKTKNDTKRTKGCVIWLENIANSLWFQYKKNI